MTASARKLLLSALTLTWTVVSCGTGDVDLGSRCPRPSGCTGGAAGNDGSSPAGGNAAGPSTGPDGVWTPLSVIEIVNPMDHGALGNGSADDLGALGRTIDALPPAGGIVYLPEGHTFKKTNLLVVTRSHVKFWAPSGEATLLQSIDGQARHQSVLCQRNDGCGFFGVKFRSDAAARFDALEDNHISADHAHLIEVAGCDIGGAAAAGVFLLASTEHYIEGNYVHHTWADHIHHTDGARESWVWKNFIFNENPSKGDNAVACVTYGTSSPRCGDMEWWKNTVLHTEWGRGYTVVGGEDISIHDNWAIGIPGAGISVASEGGAYDSPSSNRIDIRNNVVTRCGEGNGHPGILISGLNTAATPITDVWLADNVAPANVNGAYRAEGAYANVVNTGLKDAVDSLPSAVPTSADVRLADTAVLRTRDVSHVAASFRPGLYRIHVREAPAGSGFEQRFEYIVRGPDAAVNAFVGARMASGDHLSERRADAGTTYALVLTREPIAIPGDVAAVTFREMRAGDTSGALTWLWDRSDSGSY